ncbi:MAG: cytochrome c biogenesis protein CcsA [Elusimicrobia bacterium]|nr:cytochrome c biogenesis protein CcsA [Elusimicrobiota bacterium]
MNALLPLLYLATVAAYARAFFSASPVAKTAKTPLLIAALSVHLTYLLARTVFLGHPPITSLPEILSVIAFSISLAYFLLEYWTKVKGTGCFILGLPLLFQLASSLLIVNRTDVDPVLKSRLLGIHVSGALLGYAALAIAAVYGFLYLMLYHEIKSSRLGVVYERLPSLEVLERLSFISTATGFFFLTVAIAVGMAWLARAFPGHSYVDPKLIGTALIWLVYGAGLGLREAAGWYGKKFAVLSILGFALALLSMTVINLFFRGFHNFS